MKEIIAIPYTNAYSCSPFMLACFIGYPSEDPPSKSQSMDEVGDEGKKITFVILFKIIFYL